jgi:5'(3')-deoxyribonucleotidase
MVKRIGVDLDSTLNNLEEVWLARYNADYGDALTVKDMSNWDVTTYVKPECGKKMYDYLKEPGFFRNLDIKPMAKPVMEYLWNHFEVYIVSSSHPKVVGDKWDWIEHYLPFIPAKNFVPLHEKDLFKMDYLIDDGPHNIEAFSGTGILMDAAYNQHLKERYVRCYNWRDVFSYFQKVVERQKRIRT